MGWEIKDSRVYFIQVTLGMNNCGLIDFKVTILQEVRINN